MFRNLWVVIGLTIIGGIFLANSGESPNTINLSYQIGLAVVTGGFFVFFERLLSGDQNKELVNTVRELQDEVRELNEQINDLQREIEETTLVR